MAMRARKTNDYETDKPPPNKGKMGTTMDGMFDKKG